MNSSLTRARVCILLALTLCLSTTILGMTNTGRPTRGIPSTVALQADPSSPITNYAIPTANSVPDAITTGDNHTFWFTEIGAGKIGRFDSSKGTVAQEYSINETGAMPATIAVDKQGLIWFTDQNQNSPSVWFLNSTSGVFHRILTNASPSDPIFVLVDPTTNNVWFTDYYGNYLGQITTSNHSMIKHLLPDGITYPVEIAKQNGTSYLWITEATGRIARFDTATNSVEGFNPSVQLSYPVGIVVDKAGNVWVSEHGGSSVAEFLPGNSTWRKYPTSQATASPGTGVATLAMDGQGRLWFAEHYSNRIGRLDPASGEMDEFNLPIPGAYSLLDAIDGKGNFWFTEATANEIGMIPGNATSPVNVRAFITPNGSVTSGSSTIAGFVITNPYQTGTLTVSLNVTSSFTTNYYTTRAEVSLSTYSLTLGPGESRIVTAVLTPDFSLPSGLYTAGVVATNGNIASVGTVFLSVNASLWYQLETIIPEILIAAAAVSVVVFLLFRQRSRRSLGKRTSSTPKVTPAASFIALFLFLVLETGSAWGKCPGLPPPPGGGPDPYGIALDIGSIAFFAVVAYFLIRSRLRRQSPEGDAEQAPSPSNN